MVFVQTRHADRGPEFPALDFFPIFLSELNPLGGFHPVHFDFFLKKPFPAPFKVFIGILPQLFFDLVDY
jgi:hypothetical protein